MILTGIMLSVVIITGMKFDIEDPKAWMLIVSAIGSLAGVLSTILSANAKIITFLFGFIDVALYGFMCLVNWHEGQSGLGNALLHFFYFVPMQFVGFWQWRKFGAAKGGKVAARRLTNNQRTLSALIFFVGTVVLYFILSQFDRSGDHSLVKMAVFLDVLPLMFNILGQFLMSTAYMEQWFFWIGVNITSILMWSYSFASGQSDYAPIYIAKYSFYLLNSFNGLRIWLNLSRPKR